MLDSKLENLNTISIGIEIHKNPMFCLHRFRVVDTCVYKLRSNLY